MKITKKKIMITGATICVLLIFGAWHAKHARFSHDKVVKYMEKHAMNVLDRLDSTAEQKQQIQQIMAQMKIQTGEFRKQFRQNHKALFEGLMSERIDDETLHKNLDRDLEGLGKFSHRILEQLVRICRILSPEQRSDLKNRFDTAHGSAGGN